LAETKLKIAVFIDFDNIEIGVKTTLGSHFDAGAVLEAIKERGDVVTKIAYGDWTRAGDYSRSLTQHAIHMVQRNLTPGGDKNGADINLALDALEMAFTHSHINTFVIVSGDSDFMALVEKLKQYDRKVLVVGGRAFTSQILQKNCHEFIAYENLVGRRAGPRGRPQQDTPLTGAVTLVRRALKVLTDREVSPQLGVLKSTLLQLDPTFSEREYGASTFRDLVQRLDRAGYVTLKGTDRNLYVELREGTEGASTPRDAEPAAGIAAAPEPMPERVTEHAGAEPVAAAPPSRRDEPRRDLVGELPDLVERPVQRAPRAGLRVADRALEVAVLVDLDERQARVLHVVGTQAAVVRAAVRHRGREAVGQLRRLDPRLAARAVVRGVVADQDALGAVHRAPLVHVDALAAHDDLRLDHVQAFAADARGRVVEEIRTGLAGHRSLRAARTTSGR